MSVLPIGPQTPPPPPSSMAEGRVREAEARPVILYVEDDGECAALVQEELEERGFTVVVARDGREGLAILRDRGADLVLCDINMPEMSGSEVLEELNSTNDAAASPFIFLTGLGDLESERAGRKLGADDYVKKPVDFDILHAIIDARLAGVARRRLAGGASDPLSDREREALAWAARGKTFEEVAEIMRISRRTVEFHLDNARNKLGVGSRIEAAVKAAVLRLIVP